MIEKFPLASVVADRPVGLKPANGAGFSSSLTVWPVLLGPVRLPASVTVLPTVTVPAVAVRLSRRVLTSGAVVVSTMSAPFTVPDALVATRRKWYVVDG